MLAQAVYLTRDEFMELRQTMRDMLAKTGRDPGPDVERRIVAFFSVPDLSEVSP
jgi:hypothetical protein